MPNLPTTPPPEIDIPLISRAPIAEAHYQAMAVMIRNSSLFTADDNEGASATRARGAAARYGRRPQSPHKEILYEGRRVALELPA